MYVYTAAGKSSTVILDCSLCINYKPIQHIQHIQHQVITHKPSTDVLPVDCSPVYKADIYIHTHIYVHNTGNDTQDKHVTLGKYSQVFYHCTVNINSVYIHT